MKGEYVEDTIEVTDSEEEENELKESEEVEKKEDY